MNAFNSKPPCTTLPPTYPCRRYNSVSTTYDRTRGQLGCVYFKQKAGKKGFWKSGKVFSRVACVFYDGHLSDSTIATSPILRWTPLRPSDSPTPASCCKAFRIGWILNFYLKKKGRNYKNYIWLIFGFLLKQELLGKPYFKKKNRVL